MINQQASDRARPNFACTILLAVLAIGIGLQWIFWSDILETRQMVAARQQLLESLSQIADRVKVGASVTNREVPRQNAYLPGETDTIAAADLQTRVLKVAESFSATVFSAQVRPRAVNDGSGTTGTDNALGQRIDLELTFDAHINDVQKILFQLETGFPAIFVGETHIRPARSPETGEAMVDDPTLHVVLAIYGFWRK
jgi:hypothetical protein